MSENKMARPFASHDIPNYWFLGVNGHDHVIEADRLQTKHSNLSPKAYGKSTFTLERFAFDATSLKYDLHVNYKSKYLNSVYVSMTYLIICKHFSI